MNYQEILKNVARTITERGVDYGKPENMFSRAAAIASLKLDRQVTTYEVAIIMESMKDARAAFQPGKPDHHIDGLAYRAFAAMFALDQQRDSVDLSVDDLKDAAQPAKPTPFRTVGPANGGSSA